MDFIEPNFADKIYKATIQDLAKADKEDAALAKLVHSGKVTVPAMKRWLEDQGYRVWTDDDLEFHGLDVF